MYLTSLINFIKTSNKRNTSFILYNMFLFQTIYIIIIISLAERPLVFFCSTFLSVFFCYLSCGDRCIGKKCNGLSTNHTKAQHIK